MNLCQSALDAQPLMPTTKETRSVFSLLEVDKPVYFAVLAMIMVTYFIICI